MLIPQVKSRFQPCPGIWVQNLRIPERLAWGRSAEIDLTQVQFSLHVSDDLIQRSFHPAGLGYQPQQINSGESLPDWKIILQLADRMGHPMPYSSPQLVMDEIEEMVPIYQSLAYTDFETEDRDWADLESGRLGAKRLYRGLFPSGFR